MAKEFWKTSPFGEDSIFHPSWEEKQNLTRLKNKEKSFNDLYNDGSVYQKTLDSVEE